MGKDVVLVTGGTGNIGSAFVALLASHVREPTVRAVSYTHLRGKTVLRRSRVSTTLADPISRSPKTG